MTALNQNSRQVIKFLRRRLISQDVFVSKNLNSVKLDCGGDILTDSVISEWHVEQSLKYFCESFLTFVLFLGKKQHKNLWTFSDS